MMYTTYQLIMKKPKITNTIIVNTLINDNQNSVSPNDYTEKMFNNSKIVIKIKLQVMGWKNLNVSQK